MSVYSGVPGDSIPCSFATAVLAATFHFALVNFCSNAFFSGSLFIALFFALSSRSNCWYCSFILFTASEPTLPGNCVTAPSQTPHHIGMIGMVSIRFFAVVSIPSATHLVKSLLLSTKNTIIRIIAIPNEFITNRFIIMTIFAQVLLVDSLIHIVVTLKS